MHSFLLCILNQPRQTGQHIAELWLHYPLTLIWNECEIICLFGPAVLWRGDVWCFIYCHLHAQNSVNPLFVFKHLSWLLCVSLSLCWLLWAVRLAGRQWSWSGRQPAVGDDAWFQRCVIADSRYCLSSLLPAFLSISLNICPSITGHILFFCLSTHLPACWCLSCKHIDKKHYQFVKLFFDWFIHDWKYG